jgi:arabinose-5-phosphate isomerase
MPNSSSSDSSAVIEALLHEAAAISAAAYRLDRSSIAKAIGILEHCNQKVILSGVGKSGIVARKIASTFSSVGLVALYLNPLDALHGDIGVVAPGDVVILLSNSGETKELLAVLPHLRRRGTSIISIVGSLVSSLARESDVALDAGVELEADPHNLVPTASTAVAMAIGDALATVWMHRRNISPDEFATNHPAGELGKKLTMVVRDLMVPVERVQPVECSAPLLEVIEQLTAFGIGAVWVHDRHSVHEIDGLITDADLRRALRLNPTDLWARLTAQDIMTRDPITVSELVLAVDAIKMMERNSKKAISVLPVIDSAGSVVGVLRLHDLVQAGLSDPNTGGL